MKKQLPVFVIGAMLIALCLTVAPGANADTLFASSVRGTPRFNLSTVDTTVPSPSYIGGNSVAGNASDIEYGNGVIYATDTNVNTDLHVIDPATGQVTSTLTLTFPADGDVLTALEFVGGTLYAGLATEDATTTDAFLTTVDLTTGVVTTVGATGVGHPLGGLAYDGTTMYAVSAAGYGELYTVNLATGAATSIGEVTVGGTPVGMTALEFGSSGTLFGLPNWRDALGGHLLSINPATAVATDLGDLGVASGDQWSGLTSAEAAAAPPSLPTTSKSGMLIMCLLLIGASILIIRRRLA